MGQLNRANREALREHIREAGLRATAPRVAVLALLRNADRPLSHGEVVERLGTTDWDSTTLYRNLVKLVDSQLARVASTVGGIARYESDTENGVNGHRHAHFACRDCGSVECLPDVEVSVPRGAQWRRSLDEAEVQIVGSCPACRAGTTRSRRRKRALV